MSTTPQVGDVKIVERRSVRQNTGREHYVVRLRKPDGSIFEAAFTPQAIYDATKLATTLGPQFI